MSIVNTQLISDGFTSLEAGMDFGRSPERLNPNQVSFAVNTTFRYEYARTRPPFKLLNLRFDTLEQLTYFQTQVYQGAFNFSYKSIGLNAYVTVVSIGGRIFEINLDLQSQATADGKVMTGPPGTLIDGVVREITPVKADGSLDRNSAKYNKAYFCQADTWLIIQDGFATPIVYQYGQPARRSNPNGTADLLDGTAAIPPGFFEVPTGTIMAYGQGRLFLVVQGNQIVAGDIIGGGTEVIQFTENQYLSEGGSFSLSVPDNQIQAMGFTQVGDTATGNGELLAMADSSVSAFNVATDRSTWKTTPIQSVALVGVGAIGDRTFTAVNSDIWSRALDGVRSFIQSRRRFGSWQNTPMSFEVQKVLDLDTQALLPYASAAYFDRRLLMTYGPFQSGQTVVHQGLVVLSFDNVAEFNTSTTPIWEGFWTGVNPTQILSRSSRGVERCFVFSNTCTSGNQMFELQKAPATLNATGSSDNGYQPITWLIETRQMNAQLPVSKKELLNGAIWVKDINGDFDLNVEWRPDYYPCYLQWFNREYTFADKVCSTKNCQVANNQDGYVVRQLLMKPPETCLVGMELRASYGRLFQFRITGKGSATITAFQAIFRDVPERATGDCTF